MRPGADRGGGHPEPGAAISRIVIPFPYCFTALACTAPDVDPCTGATVGVTRSAAGGTAPNSARWSSGGDVEGRDHGGVVGFGVLAVDGEGGGFVVQDSLWISEPR